MHRRELLKLLGVVTSFGSKTAWSLESPSTAKQFRKQLAAKPWLLGYKSVDQEHYQAAATLHGRWPKELRGTLYRNGPGQHEIGNFRYEHWFDGDGLVQAFDITDAGVTHRARLTDTHKRWAEKQAGRVLFSGFGTIIPDAEPMTDPDQVNPANISMLHHHGKLFALWEAGSAHEIDPGTLETKGIHTFSPQTEGVPFSAHPRVDADGHLWNFGYSSAFHQLVMWHIDPQGELVKAATIACDPISMPHDFILTSRHLVVLIPPLHFEDSEEDISFLGRHRWYPDLPTRVLVVDKSNFDEHYWLELPAQWTFHFGNGWEDEDGVIRFDGSHYSDPHAMQYSFSEVMRGITPGREFGNHQRYRIDTRTRSITTENIGDTGVSTDFPTIDPRLSTLRNDKVVCLTGKHDNPSAYGLLNAVSLLNMKTESMQTFTYPSSQIPEEHLFVPAPGSKPESQGWIIGMALDYKKAHTMLNVFDADALDAGPIATAELPYAMPLGFHGTFVSRA